jgi:hypothetical protein
MENETTFTTGFNLYLEKNPFTKIYKITLLSDKTFLKAGFP